MNLHIITTGIIILGLILTVYCISRLGASYRQVIRTLRDNAASVDAPRHRRRRR
jgi:hypothetical protein